MTIENLISLIGCFAFLGIAYLLSNNRRRINWHVMVWGVGLQLLIAWFLFVVPAGAKFFLSLNSLVVNVLSASTAGAEFLFGRLALAPGQTNAIGESSLGFVMAFQVFPSIIFFAALVSILYFVRLIPFVIKQFAYLFTKLMRISGAEALCAASNIFVGVESAVMIKPYLKKLTPSEFCAILTASMATVSSNVLAIYVISLQGQFNHIAGHLISASFLSAPAALVMANFLFPEDKFPETLGEKIEPYVPEYQNLFEAIIDGAQNGVKLIVGIVALLIAVLGLVRLFDMGFGGILTVVNDVFGSTIQLNLQQVLGWLFTPLTFLTGVPLAELEPASRLIGQRLLVTEVVSYQELGQLIATQQIQDPRTVVVVTYALCGFAHFASMAIFVGGIVALVPEKRREIATVAPRALGAATLACLQTAAVAGLFYLEGSTILGG